MLVAAIALSTLPLSTLAQPIQRAAETAAQIASPLIELHGVTLYDGAALLAHAQSLALQGDTPDLAAIASNVQQVYHQDGWFLAEARAFGDPTSNRHGILVEEGRVRAFEVVGVAEQTGRRIASYFYTLLDGTPLRLDAFERALMLAGDLSGMSVRSEFVHDPMAGGYRGVLHATQRGKAVSALVDSVPRASAMSTFVSGETYSLLSPGDLTRLVVGVNTRTNGRERGLNGALFYRLPIGNNGLYAEAYASQLNQTLESVGPTIEQRIQRGKLVGALVGYPVLRNIDSAVYAILAAERRASDADSPVSISDRSNAMRLSAYYTSTNMQAPAFRTGLTLSVGNAHSAQNPAVDRQFWHLRVVAGTVIPFGEPDARYALRLEGYAKYASHTLPEVERMFLGDRDRMRGYMIGAATGDSGAIGTVELSRHFPLGTGSLRAVTPSVFLDLGTVRKNSPSPVGTGGRLQEQTVNLASIGVATRVDLAAGFTVSGWIGLPLLDGGTGVKHSPAAYFRLTKAW